MLRDQHSYVGVSPFFVALALIGASVCGVDGPAQVVRAERPEGVNSCGCLPNFDRSYLPAETVGVVAIRPIKLADATFSPVFVRFPGMLSLSLTVSDREAALEIAEVQAILLQKLPNVNSTEPPALVIYRTSKPYDWNELRTRILGEPDSAVEVALHGHKCYRVTSDATDKVVNYVLADERTIVCFRDQDTQRILAADPDSHPSWYGKWQEAAKSPIAAGGSLSAIIDEEWQSAEGAWKTLASIVGKMDLMFATVDCTAGRLDLRASASCKAPDEARQILQLSKLLLTLGVKQAPEWVKSVSLADEFRSLDVAGTVAKVLASTVIDAEASNLQLKVSVDADTVAQFSKAATAYGKRFSEEVKATHIANLSRLVKGLNSYHADHGYYPTSSVIGPDGTTPHSWRVAILPYLDEQKLYDRYKLDEPWDSEHNKSLVNEIPAVFHSGEWTQKGCTEYYLATGDGTLFDGDPSPTRESITDDAAETVLVAENRRRVAWTKPQDIENAAGENTSRLTGAAGFYAGFADGSAKHLSGKTEPATLRALMTKAGGEKVKLR